MIRIICIGKPKNRQIEWLLDEYLKRISRYAKLEIVCLKEEKIRPDIMKQEGKRILLELDKKKSIEYALVKEGKQMSSEDFSKMLEGDLTFVIGGFQGLSEDVTVRTKSISLSRMTFTHEIALMILVEQIYRGYTIRHNENYHK